MTIETEFKDELIQTRGRKKLNKNEVSKTFNLYLARKKVGDKMIKSFLGNKIISANKQGFSLREDSPVGIISQCYGIITLAEYLKFDLDLEEYPEAAERISTSFNEVLKAIKIDSGEPIFEPTPYVFDSGIKDYIETVTLVLKVAIEVRNLLCIDLDKMRDTVKVDPKYLEGTDLNTDTAVTNAEIRLVNRIIAKCFKVLTDSALTLNGDGVDYYLFNSDTPLGDAFGNKMLYKGWTFTTIPKNKHDKCEPSLYFTYLVGEAYLTFFEYFEDSISIVRRLTRAIQKKNGWYLAPATRQKWEDTLKSRGQFTDINYSDVPFDELDRLVSTVEISDYVEYEPELANIVNVSSQVLADINFLRENYTLYRKFQKAMMDAGRYVDTNFAAIDTTKDFFSYNFKLTTAKNIEESSSSDSMFNVLFAINILLASGVDSDYADNGKDEEFYESLRYTIPNIQKLYRKFVREGKESICDQYTLKFNENIPIDDSADSAFVKVRTLRKQRILVYNLTPILIKTYSTLSKYLTPYPQYEMQSYEKEIMINKMQSTWLWDRDSFHLITNYNYVYVLRMFYEYYETYELPFATAEDTYINQSKAELAAEQQKREALKEKHQKDLKERDERFSLELKEKDREIARLTSSRTPVEEEIGKLVKFYLEGALKDLLEKMIEHNGHISNPDDDINTAFKRMVISLFNETKTDIMSYADFNNTTGEDRKSLMEQLEKRIFDNLLKAIRTTYSN